jgi:hypothetical protein
MGRRRLPLTELSAREWRAFFDPVFLRYAGCVDPDPARVPATVARVLSIVAQRRLRQLRDATQLEIFF